RKATLFRTLSWGEGGQRRKSVLRFARPAQRQGAVHAHGWHDFRPRPGPDPNGRPRTRAERRHRLLRIACGRRRRAVPALADASVLRGDKRELTTERGG